MRIINKTDLDGRQVAGVIRRAARDLEVEKEPFVVIVRFISKPGYPYSGWFDPNQRQVRIRIATPSKYPLEDKHRYKRKDSPPEHVCHNWQEALAAIAGHEFMHLRQWKRSREGKKGNVRGKYNEVETQFAEYRAWQREHERTIARKKGE